MIKILLFILVLFLLLPSPSFAQGKDFDINLNASYVFNEQGEANVQQRIEITNNTEFIHAPDYTITLNVAGIEEMQVTSLDGRSIPFTVNDTPEGGKNIKVVFPQRVAGIGTSQNFILSYKTSTLSSEFGNSWELNIPSVQSDEFTSSTVDVTVPESFGQASIVKPESASTQDNVYTYEEDVLENGGALLIFGDTEYYRLDLLYELENANFFPLRTEIALPPHTPTQDVIFEDISPRPQNVYIDNDDNYLAQYTLRPHEKMQIKASVLVKVSAQSRSTTTLSDAQKRKYTQRQRYWEQSADIKKLAKELSTPEQIYNYIVKEFNYNHTRNTDSQARLGAQAALHNKDDFVCLEFTDLFIAIARASGIPARSVEGYAYTQNPETKPRSLVKDILHAWPEYYDQKSGTWIAIDPTWGNTTGGIDYFSSLDLSHITFVRKGEDSQYPIPPGGYKTSERDKHVNVSFATQQDFQKNEQVDIAVSAKKTTNPFGSAVAQVSVTNTGNTPIIDKKMSVSSGDEDSTSFTIDNLPPYASENFDYTLSSNALTKKDHLLTIQFDKETVTREVTSGIDSTTIFKFIGGGIFATLILGLSAKGGSVLISRRKK